MDQATKKFFADILSDNAEAGPAVAKAEASPVMKSAEPVKEQKPSAAISKPIPQKKINPKLAAYIEAELKHGVSSTDIKKGLLTAHWPEKEVDTALSSIKL